MRRGPVLLLLALLGAAGALAYLAFAGEPLEAVEYRPLPPPDDAARPAAAPLPPDGPATAERQQASDAVGAPERAPTWTGWLEGRAVDATGSPLPFPKLRTSVWRAHRHEDADAANLLAGGDGRFKVACAVDDRDEASPLTLTVMHPTALAQELRLAAYAERTVMLGDVVLHRAGGIAGEVVDERGAGVALARVECTTVAELPDAVESRGPEGDRLAATTTDAAGRFRMAGVPPGRVRLWAHADGTRWGYTRPFVVKPHQESHGIRLVLEPEIATHFVRGVVLTPDGAPVAGAKVTASLWHADHPGRHAPLDFQTETDREGRFEIGPNVWVAGWRIDWSRGRADVEVADAAGLYALAEVRAIAYGTHDVVVRLAALQRAVTLRVRDEAGAPVGRLSVQVGRSGPKRHASSNFAQLSVMPARPELRIGLPPEPFELAVLHELSLPFRREFASPADVPDPFDVVLARPPGVRGVITAGGRPLPGAEVWISDAYDPGGVAVVDGFPARRQPGRKAAARSDVEGRFWLPLVGASDECWVMADHAELAPAEAGPLSIDPARGLDGVRLELTSGGSLEGRVAIERDPDLARSTVWISRGDGRTHTAPVAADGSYRFARLLPGRYRVELRADRDGGQTRSRWTRDPNASDDLPYDVIVREGETARYDLAPAARVRLRTVLRLAGREPADWRATALGDDSRIAGEASGNGGFRFQLPRAGRFELELRGPLGEAAATFTVAVEVGEDEAEWSLDLPTASLRGRARGTQGRETTLRYRWTCPSTLLPASTSSVEATVVMPVPAGGAFHFASLPAGPGRLEQLTVGAGVVVETTTLAEIELERGREQELGR